MSAFWLNKTKARKRDREAENYKKCLNSFIDSSIYFYSLFLVFVCRLRTQKNNSPASVALQYSIPDI